MAMASEFKSTMKSKYKFLLSGWPVLVALFFALTMIIIYHVRDWPTSKFYVLRDDSGQNTLLINGKDINDYKKHVPGWEVYCTHFLVYGKQATNRVTIQRDNAVVFEKELEPGSYVANLSDNQNVSFREVAYGRPVARSGLILAPSPVGVYLIARSMDILVFDFYAEPPDSMSSRRKSAQRKTYFNLTARQIER